MKILNLYAGIGGNRKLWGDEHEVTAVEIEPYIAAEYQKNFPNDKVIVGDAHEYLLKNYMEFDFIWASPPCPTHSRLCNCRKEKKYPSMVLYQEIIFLKQWFKGSFVIENVIPYYPPLIEPTIILGRHLFWSNFNIAKKEFDFIDLSRKNKEEVATDLGIEVPKCKNARLLVRNCLKPEIGLHIFDEVLRIKNEVRGK